MNRRRKREGIEENRVVWGIFLLQCFSRCSLKSEGSIFIITITKSNLNALFKMTSVAPISIE